MLYYTTALRRCQALPALRRRKMQPAGVGGGRKRQKARKNRLRSAAYGLSARQEAGISASEDTGDAARRPEKRQYAPLRGGKNKRGKTSRCAFSPRLGAGAVFRRLFADRRILPRAVPSRLPCRFSGFVQMALRPDCRSFSQASCRRRHAARLRALPSAASPLRLREGGSPRSARRSPGPPSRCPAGGNNRRWRP